MRKGGRILGLVKGKRSLSLSRLEGILNCRVPVLFGVVEAVNGNVKALLRRGRGYKNLRYRLLKAQRPPAQD